VGAFDFSDGRLIRLLNIQEIQRILPHRFPFLLVDRIVELEPQKRAVGIKNVTINESFFQGHYPGSPVMPGVLLVEAMAQVGGIAMLSVADMKGRVPYFTGIDKVRFRKPVVPGDQVRIVTEIVKSRRNMVKCEAQAFVDGELAAEAELMFAAVDIE